MQRKLGFFTMLVLLVGCTSIGRMEADVQPPTKDQFIFVIGLAPDNYRVGIFGGTEKNDRFTQNWLPAVFYGGAQGGYIVGKGNPMATLAITGVQVTANDKTIVGTDYQACGGAEAAVFNGEPAKVIYLGDVEFKSSGKGLDRRYSNDLEKARSYLSTAYPALAGKLEQGSFRLLPTDVACN